MENISILEVKIDQRLVGRLLLRADGVCLFEYSNEWLANGFSISPFELPLRPGVFEAKRSPFEGGFGVFDDSMPDGWGLLIMDRHLQCLGIQPNDLNLLDRLALVGSAGRGALEFYPDKSFSSTSEAIDFFKLQKEIAAILQEDKSAEATSILCEKGNWRLAPAFDLLPSNGIGGYHTTSFNNSINPRTKTCWLWLENSVCLKKRRKKCLRI